MSKKIFKSKYYFKITSIMIVAVTIIASLGFSLATPVYGADVEPVLSFSFDGQDNNMTAVYNSDGTLAELQDFSNFTFEEGKLNSSLYLDGSYGLKLNTDNLSSESYAICFWVKPSEITAHTPILSMVRGHFDEKNYSTVLLDENWLQPNITSIYTDDSGSSSYSAGIASALTQDVWTHIAIVVDATASEENYFEKMYLYIDGEYACDGLMLKNLCDSSSDFWVGIDPYSETFKGYIDELLIFDTALTTAEVASVYNTDDSSSDVPVPDDNEHKNHGNRPNGNQHGNRPGNQQGSQSGNIFDDIIELDQGALPDTDNSPLSAYLNPGLAAGMEYKTDAYAEIAFVIAIILIIISLCCFLTYTKKKRNQY